LVDDSVQFIGIKPKALADRADVDFHLPIFLHDEFSAAFGAMHPMEFLKTLLFGID